MPGASLRPRRAAPHFQPLQRCAPCSAHCLASSYLPSSSSAIAAARRRLADLLATSLARALRPPTPAVHPAWRHASPSDQHDGDFLAAYIDLAPAARIQASGFDEGIHCLRALLGCRRIAPRRLEFAGFEIVQ